jgi:DNA modification methylase
MAHRADPGVIGMIKERSGRLEQVFVIPPISVLDVKSGRWKKRKKIWKSLGMESDLGRAENLLSLSALMKRMKQNDTSIFDPVLCECMYRWFTKEGDNILDCFAGGSVRGIVASKLKRNYTGIDLSENQIEHNIMQGKKICESYMPNWICDNGLNVDKLEKKFDFLFSCPPYYNLEVYSDNAEDISTMKYDDFIKDYREIIRKSCERLNDNSFAVFVVGEVRENDRYVGFVPDTIRAFEDAGMSYYNEMILLQEPATAAMRAEKFMNASRKISKSHQNVLMFSKGSPQDSAKRMGKFDDNFDEILYLKPMKPNLELF